MSNCSSNNNSLRIKLFRSDSINKESKDNTLDSFNFKIQSEMNSPRLHHGKSSMSQMSRADSIKSVRTLTSQGKYFWCYKYFNFIFNRK